MNANRLCAALLFVAAVHPLFDREARAGGVPYTIDILSGDRYPGLKDAWMYRINNQGVAAGYIATNSSSGPYLPATYTGNGQFQTYGIQSAHYFSAVTGLNDRGDVVGNLYDKDFNQTPYIIQGGVVSYPDFPADSFPYMYGINDAGIAYGSYFDDAAGLGRVFTVAAGAVTPLLLSAPGFNNFDSGLHALTDSGLLGVIGYSDDFSTSQGFIDHLGTGVLTPLAMPDGFVNFGLVRLTEAGREFGLLFNADYSITRLGSWGGDGAFLGFLDVPDGMDPYGVQFNDLGQAAAILNGSLMFYNGSSWAERDVPGAGRLYPPLRQRLQRPGRDRRVGAEPPGDVRLGIRRPARARTRFRRPHGPGARGRSGGLRSIPSTKPVTVAATGAKTDPRSSVENLA